MLMVGVAHQAGALPVAADAIEQAIREGGAAVEMSLLAFRWGRALAAGRAYVLDFLVQGEASVPRPVLSTDERALVDCVGGGGELRRLLEIRVPELVAYQSLRYAAARHRDAVALANLADQVRGYEDVKLAGIARYRSLVSVRANVSWPAA